ncbi:MAG: NADH-quinone oxidoreductase subunit D [Deltaproteobacteria bacterium]|nr:NADH-quinone oxidoreductase subunit D [Deltaproteobacteria bacterium]
MALNMGPQHPSTHGVFRVKLHLDGEVVVKAVPYLGYLHRGVEKLCEKLTYVQITPIVDKNDYVSPMMNELAVNMAFEALGKVEVPRRARYLRSICAELQRAASHLLWLGTFCLDIGGGIGGGASVFMYTFQERELILDLFEELTGARFHYNYHQVGGVRHDVPAGWAEKVNATAKHILGRLEETEAMLIDNGVFLARSVNVGVLDAVLAQEVGVGGPALRASGVDWDLRKARPYAAYNEIEVKTFVEYTGDAFARFKVRMAETREALRLATTLLSGLPEGPVMGGKFVKLPGGFKPPAGQVYVGIESPRGELGTYVISDGTPNAYRLKIRPPSFHALALTPYLLPGATISDVVTILGSLDPIMGEADR